MFLLLLIDLLLIELLLIGFLLIRFPINQISVDWFPCCRFTAPAHPTSTASGAGMFRYFLFALISLRLSLFAYLFSLISFRLSVCTYLLVAL